MQNPKTEGPRPAVGSTGRPSGTRMPAADGSDTPEPDDDEAASAMIEEGDRPDPERRSVEGLSSADRPGGMAGEG